MSISARMTFAFGILLISGALKADPAVNHVSAGDGHFCAILDDGVVKCWGANGSKQLGATNAFDPVTLGNNPQTGKPYRAINIAGSGDYNCAILEDKRIKCWGANNNAQLGTATMFDYVALGNNANGQPYKAKGIVCGYQHACAVLEDGLVKCWGANDSKQLGAAQAFGVVDLGKNANGQAISTMVLSASDNHTCALLEDGSVKCWGAADSVATLGAAPFKAVDLGVNSTTQKPVKAVSISSGYSHTCAALEDGGVKCWGDVAPKLGGAAAFTPVMLGKNPATGKPYKAINVGTSEGHSCALLEDGLVKCWGNNDNGQLGLGDVSPRSKPEEMGDNLPLVDVEPGAKVSELICDGSSCCAVLKASQTLKCWGGNGSGQLGTGDTADRGEKAGQMGENLPFVYLGPLAKVMK